jgi:hypothetical protein
MQARSKARPAARLSKAQYEMLAAFRYQLRQFLHFSEQAAQNAGLTPRQRAANRYEELVGQREYQAHRARNNELSDLEGFVMSPGQDMPAAIENAVIMLAVSASKIERGSA